MTWRRFIEEHEGEAAVLEVVNREFAKHEENSYDDEMPMYIERKIKYA